MNSSGIARRSRALDIDENGDARLYGAFGVMAALTVMLALFVVNSTPVDIGPSEGKFAPNITAPSHLPGGDWDDDFVLYDNIDRDWEQGLPGKYFLIQFIDTDCGHCWTEGEEMSMLYNSYSQIIEFVTVAISLGNPGWVSSKAEIAAFQEKGDYDGCNSNQNCNTRPGDAHPWVYLEDLGNGERGDWDVTSTPFAVILDPSGHVLWNMGQHMGEEDLPTAMYKLFDDNSGGA